MLPPSWITSLLCRSYSPRIPSRITGSLSQTVIVLKMLAAQISGCYPGQLHISRGQLAWAPRRFSFFVNLFCFLFSYIYLSFPGPGHFSLRLKTAPLRWYVYTKCIKIDNAIRNKRQIDRYEHVEAPFQLLWFHIYQVSFHAEVRKISC